MNDKKYIVNDILLMSEWNHEANLELDPNKLTRGSNKKAFWVCSKCGHKWQTSIYHRATRGTSCPQCHYGKRDNINSNKNLVITNPEVAENWHQTKNGKLTPDMFLRGSRYKAWWKCKTCGNEWEKEIKNYRGCSHCKKHSTLLKNNLGANNPELVKE